MIRGGEGRRVVLLFAQLLSASAIFILGRTVRDTLFLSRYSLSALPWMFVAYGAVSACIAVVYARFADRLPRHTMLVGTAAIGATTYLGTWGCVTAGVTWIYPLFYVWSEVVANLFLVQFWTLANELFDARAAKRLFGVVGAARVLGVILIGTSTGAS
jgi:ATP/ADP translocase